MTSAVTSRSVVWTWTSGPVQPDRWWQTAALMAAVLATSTAALVLAIASGSATADEQRESGIPQRRLAWTTSRITGSPDPPLPYVTRQSFPALQFKQCLDLTSAPGSNRLFIVEQAGRILSFVNTPDVKTSELVVDLSQQIPGVKQTYALTFHPDFEQNRHCYICYIKDADLEDGTTVSRFVVADTDPPVIDVTSETPLLTWRSGGHNGCCLKFGADGYLYISTGDAGPANPPDPLRAGQDLSNLLSAILRIDVDHTEQDRNYRIPPDNPFVDLPGARGEIWAYGLRNPWRMSFDRLTGDLWVGDVGWELWEMLYRVERGGNYGWSIMEGRQPTNPEWPRGPTPILLPTIDHPHSESSSITDGLTYYGKQLPELYGMHIYSDYDTGKFWAFRYRDGHVVDHQEIADTTHRVVGFGEDPYGEMYLLDHTAGTIHQLVPNPKHGQTSAFPRLLSESGLLQSIEQHLPADGVVSYLINAQAWADQAIAERLVAIPGDLSIQAQGESWKFPQDSVLAKTLSLETEPGNSASRRRVETQILHFDGQEWNPYTFSWNDEQTDAVLVDASGAEREFEISDTDAPDGKRRQVWRYSGRAECQRCHNRWSGPPLAFNAPQLSHNHAHAGIETTQLDQFATIMLIDKPVTLGKLGALADPADHSADLNDRARAYLHTNCAHCHRLHAGSAVLSKMPFDVPLDKMDMVGVRPTQGTFGIPSAQVIAPGDPFGSILFFRMAKLGNGRMPHIGSSEIDVQGLRLIADWIEQLPSGGVTDIVEHGGDNSERSVATRLRAQDAELLRQLQRAEESSEFTDLVQRMLSSTSSALMLLRAIDDQSIPKAVMKSVIESSAVHSDTSVRDLFERFLPPEQRVRRLGSEAQADQILSLAGNAARGRQIFFDTAGVQCRSCHRVGSEGTELGPDLTTIGRKYTPAQILENLLEPSKQIDPKYVTYLAETTEGRLFSGLLVSRDAAEVVLRNARNELVKIAADQIEQIVPQQQSLMPDLLLREMTAQQAADLLEYLTSLK